MRVSRPAKRSDNVRQRCAQRAALLASALSSLPAALLASLLVPLALAQAVQAEVAVPRAAPDPLWAQGAASAGGGDDGHPAPIGTPTDDPRCPNCQVQPTEPRWGPWPCPHCGQMHPEHRAPLAAAEPAALRMQPLDWAPTVAGLSWHALGDRLPVLSEPWQQRPLGGGVFLGALRGDEALEGQIDLRSGLLYGVRLTGDWRRNWAWECRLATATLDAVDLTASPARRDRDADVVLGDVSLVYAPVWTNRLRPFVSAGIGFAFFEFADPRGRVVHETTLGLPLGAGIKYRWDDWLLAYLEFRDQIALGDSNALQTTHNLAIVVGAELRFGGSRRSYYPWNPSLLGR